MRLRRKPRRILDRDVTPAERGAHDRVTREIITGLLANAIHAGRPLTAISGEIMGMLRRRGYRAAITGVNRLEDGTYC